MNKWLLCLALLPAATEAFAQCSGGSCSSSGQSRTRGSFSSFGTCASGSCSLGQSFGAPQGYYTFAPSQPALGWTYRLVAPPSFGYAPTAQVSTDCPNGTCANCQCANGVCQSGSCPVPVPTANVSRKVEWKQPANCPDESALFVDGVQVGSVKFVTTHDSGIATVRTDWCPIENGKWGERVTVATKHEFVGRPEPIPVPPMPADVNRKR